MNEDLIFITAEESGERVDALLARIMPELSRNAVQRLLEDGNVLLSSLPVKKNYKVKTGDVFELLLPEPDVTDIEPQNIPLDIRYEDSSVIVINKPRGMVVHPAPGHKDRTLVNALMYYCGDSLSGIGGELRPGIVHRIDKDTSGLLIVAKDDFSHRALSAQLSDRSLSREYEAVVIGGMREDSGTIDKPIGRSPADRKKMAVYAPNGRDAVTDWRVIERYRGYTHLLCSLRTGRTHQIRVHMASISHPLLGDNTYGAPSPDKGLEGQCLHARRLKFIHPVTGEKIVIESELPEYFTDVLSRLAKL